MPNEFSSSNYHSKTARTVIFLLLAVSGIFLATTIVFAVLYGVQRNKASSNNESGPTTEKITTTTDPTAMNNVCLSPFCVRAANYLLESINASADPCDNFFEFACGKWLEKNRIPDDAGSYDTFTTLRNQLDNDIVDMLVLPLPSDLASLNSLMNARRLYQSCINETIIEQEAVGSLLEFVNTELGGWPVLLGSSWNEATFNFTRLVLKLRQYNHHVLYSSGTSTDDKNSSINYIRIAQSDLALEQRTQYETETKVTSAYREFMRNLAKELANGTTIDGTEIDDIFNFEKNISRHHWTPAEQRARQNETVRTTIANLSRAIDTTFDFTHYLRYMYTLSNIELKDDDIVSVSEVDYLTNVTAIINRSSARTIQNYFVWRFIMGRLGNLPKRYRALRDPFDEAFRGTVAQRPRSITCGSYVNSNMGFALSKVYIRRYFDENARQQSLEMITNIRAAFLEMLGKTDWMDEISRNRSIEKALAISDAIGYPTYLGSDNVTQLENMYQGYDFTDSYIKNALKLSQIKSNESLRILRDPVDRRAWGLTPPTTVNAFYSPSKNQISFPAAILQAPFFNNDAPKYLNYGGIGAVIGHEITHGFDDSGRQFDKDGNRLSWWTPETIEKFTQRKQCIIDQYSKYLVVQINRTLNGQQTQGENIADNGGIKEAFYAYQKWAQTNGNADRRLPGLNNYTPEQMFFINYGQIWCSKMTDANALGRILTGVHSPGEFRIRGPTSNFEEFSRAFNCKPGQGNNPTNKCSVW